MTRRSRILLGSLAAVALLAAIALGVFTAMIGGPSMLLGMLRYDERKEGTLQVGDAAPDFQLATLDVAAADGVPITASLLGERGGRPLVLIFGSFT